MPAIIKKPDLAQRLDILSTDGQYDLACACGSDKDDRRARGSDGKWIYPVTLPNGGKSVIFKTLISNGCVNDCKYCPLRAEKSARRCSITPDETARTFLDYYRRKKVFGLFLSSGVIGSPETAMQNLVNTAKILRSKYNFRGYIHLKVIPGASDAAITEAVSLASAVSLNIETPGEKNFAALSKNKDYLKDIIAPIKLISKLTSKGMKHSRVKQTTQFIVGAAGEKDSEIVESMANLYNELHMQRVYFSAYQKGLGSPDLPGENQPEPQIPQPTDTGTYLFGTDVDFITQKPGQGSFMREHRLYQVDFLMRRYGFKTSDIIFENAGRLSLTADPKQIYANANPHLFPVNLNTADKQTLLKIPGIGPTTATRIINQRKQSRIKSIREIPSPAYISKKATNYVTF